eukprot:4514244-Prorocentrum_lima.AAC.1
MFGAHVKECRALSQCFAKLTALAPRSPYSQDLNAKSEWYCCCNSNSLVAVSYTHLTLPTICSV